MLKLEIIEIKQPFGVFYATKIKASDLLKIAEADPYRVLEDGQFVGIQRPRKQDRLEGISNYLKGAESALPNSIIIAGNTKSKSESDRWIIITEGSRRYLFIPKKEINGAIIDGQHRLNGFKLLSKKEQEEYELLCSVYLDIPNPYQAFLFATINMNQKKVDKSLAYELYGYNLDEENSTAWSPEKLAVSLSRKLNFDDNSIFRNHIVVAAENDEVLFDVLPKNQDWSISTASIVDGILLLITTDAQRDRDKLQQTEANKRNRNLLTEDRSPLRKYFIENNDKLIFEIVNNFFNASYKKLYRKGSYIFKTVGIQAQFNLLKTILQNHLEQDKDISINYYSNILEKCSTIDFTDNFFTASGLGKSRINNALLIRLGYKDVLTIKKEDDRNNYKRILKIN